MRGFVFALLALLLAASSSTVLAVELPSRNGAAMALRYSTNIPLGQDDAESLFEKSLSILQSSNFNSAAPRWEWDPAKIKLEYGRAVSGQHVLITFRIPKIIETVGGKVIAREIVIGLNGPQYASSLHTVDAEGRVVEHSKYSGPLCIEILEMVKEIAFRSSNKAMEPTR